MKAFLLAVALLASQTAFSEIKASTFEARHQSLIEKAVYDKCGLNGPMTLVSTTEKADRVDQGITDIYYTTELSVKSTVDQYVTFFSKVVVESVKFDMYDHSTQNWGAYSVTSVTCE